MTEFNQLKRLSIRSYLQHRGITPQRENEQAGFYLSPIRNERTPSFKVDYVQNLWFDFGIGEGGSIIDLVMLIEHCDFAHAVHLLENDEPITDTHTALTAAKQSPLNIVEVLPLQSAALINYLRSRQIDLGMAKQYCREVHYSVGDRHYFAIGFQNDTGGWELRSEHFKGNSTSKNITTINNGNSICLAFEGFMDFLSYLTLKLPAELTVDVAVLNSVTNLSKALPFLQSHRVIHTFLDNDGAGRRTTADIVRLCPNSEVIDRSAFYRYNKDINEYLKSHSPLHRGRVIK